MRSSARAAGGAALALALAASSAAVAGPPQSSPRRLWVPWSQGADAEGVAATVHHAAGLGFMPGFELGLGVSTRLSGDEAVNSVTGLVGGRVGPLAVGLGLSGIGDGPGTDSTTLRFDLGLALRLSDGFALGLQWSRLSSDVSDALDRFDTWSLSATLRPVRALSVALSLDQLDTPELAEGQHLDPIARLSLGLRPGTERLTFGLEASRVLGAGALWTVGGSLRAMLIPGLVVGGYGRLTTPESGDGPSGVEAGVLVGLHQGGMGLESSVDLRDGDAAQGANLTTLLRARSQRFASLSTDDEIVVHLTLRGRIPERPAAGLLGGGASGFAHWLEALDVISRDADVAGVLLDIEAAPSWGQIWELRQALRRVRDAGKKVFAKLTMADMRGIYLAAAADKVFMYAAGGALITGLSSTRTYYLGSLQKLGVEAEIVKWEDYKSAPESFTRTGPSEPAREQGRAILDGVWRQWLQAVAVGRGIDRSRLSQLVAEGPYSYAQAKDKGFVDALVWEDGVKEAIEDELGPGVLLNRRYRPAPRAWKRWGGQRKVAIIPVVGSIVDGKSAGALPIPFLGSQTTGDRTFVAALEAAARDASFVGIVVRVDSGGGSAVASDKMYRAVQRAAKDKPLVVSFGNVAASGGYYLAAGAPEILATPMTITGSIGIFAGKADLSGLYAKLGMSTHTDKTSASADMLGRHRRWTEAERAKAKATLKAYYDRFVELVSKGRQLPLAAAYAAARGRVYLGAAALELKLVDAYGGLWDAIERVRAKAGVGAGEPLSLRYYGGLGALSGVQRLIAGVIGLEGVAAEPAAAVGDLSTHAAALFGRLQSLHRGAPLAQLPYTLTIE